VNEPKKILALCKTLAPHRGDTLKPLRMMIMGVPNVGKSTLMNAILNRRIAKVGDEPAITKQQQRHQINDHMILIDTPGMMWPNIRYPSDGDLLAANNNIGKNAYFEEEVAEKLGAILLKNYPTLLQIRYKLESLDLDAINLLEWIAKKKGFPLKNQIIDLERSSVTLLNDYRQGSLGRISLETPKSREFMVQKTMKCLDIDEKKADEI
jgi:ribosome biogenesis GTPase A